MALGSIGFQPIGETFDPNIDWTANLRRVIPERPASDMSIVGGVDPAWDGPDDDEELLKRALRSGSAGAAFGMRASFKDLWEADGVSLARHYPTDGGERADGKPYNASGADGALAMQLAFWTGRDVPRMDRLFRRSALMRPKWDKHKSYAPNTLNSAAGMVACVYQGPAGKKAVGATINSDDPWPTLDRTVLDTPEGQAPMFPLDILPKKLRDFILEAAAAKNAPVEYVAWPIITTSGRLIGNARKAKIWSGWKEPIALWVCLVGAPSTNKSPALDVAIDVIRRLEGEFVRKFKKEYAMWKAKQDAAKAFSKKSKVIESGAGTGPLVAPSIPRDSDGALVLQRLTIGDATVEAICAVIATNPRGLTVVRDELAGWFYGMGRYNNGGDRQFFLEAFGGRTVTVDRKSNPEPIIVQNCLLSVLGTTQPDKLYSLLFKSENDGMSSRILSIWPERVPPGTPEWRV